MTDKHCETECREELLAKISMKVCRSTMWKFTTVIVTVIIAVGGILYSSYAGGVDKRDANVQKIVDKQEIAIEKATKAIQANTVAIAEMWQALGALSTGQTKLEHKMEEQTTAILHELRKQ